MASVFEAHCVDSWVLANQYTGGHIVPDFIKLFLISPIQPIRRQLHKQQFATNGIRGNAGGTRKFGFKKGSLVKHKRLGTIAYVGGFNVDKLILNSLTTGKRVHDKVNPKMCITFSYGSFRHGQLA